MEEQRVAAGAGAAGQYLRRKAGEGCEMTRRPLYYACP